MCTMKEGKKGEALLAQIYAFGGHMHFFFSVHFTAFSLADSMIHLIFGTA